MKRETIAVAGATGFIGRHLVSQLSKDYNVIALTRSKQNIRCSKRIRWRKVDLFSIHETSAALRGVDKWYIWSIR
ncbi:MAG: NAD(P)H-binding protein [Bdellovibrionales bacterium]|nr:NAD(P)H-binding protein [Bdellovibrionales bacterium]